MEVYHIGDEIPSDERNGVPVVNSECESCNQTFYTRLEVKKYKLIRVLDTVKHEDFPEELKGKVGSAICSAFGYFKRKDLRRVY